MAQKSNFKRLIRKYEYLSEEFLDIQEMLSEATRNFNKALSGSDNADQYLPDGSDKDEDEDKERVEMTSKYKKLFRKIVLKCHPDKISENLSETEKLELRSIYEICTESYDLGEPTPLIVCAVKLDIDVSEFEEDIEEIEKSCIDIQNMIDEIQGTAAWYYEFVLKEEKEKEVFIEKFVELTKGKNIEDL